MATNFDLSTAAEIATLKERQRALLERIEVMEEACEKRDKDLEGRVKTLERWKGICDGVATGWGFTLIAISSLFALIASYWDSIVSVVQKLRP